ncbi:MAG TPA: hypothetical protein PLB91_15310 [Spirochaetales bacterium]|nr:hypothetical protein [Spirochaetales bacterium]HRY55857.1 hypothetical protein [Spirochaetia bacterium]
MSYGADRASAGKRGLAPVEKYLAAAAALLVLVIAAGTAFGLAAGTRQRKLEREADGGEAPAAYLSIGTVRARSADPKPAVVVATLAFPYDPADRAFAEELGRKLPALKAAAASCLSRKKAAELAPAYEGAVKAALRDCFNSLLSLGRIEEIWLSDFSVIQ